MIVAMVNHDPSDTHAAGSAHEAFRLANPDPKSRVDFFVVRSDDPGEARMLYDSTPTRHCGTIDPTDWAPGGARVELRLHSIGIDADRGMLGR